MADYDFTASLSPLDFELLSKDLLEAELGISLENFREGRDKGIDLRYAPVRGAGSTIFNFTNFGAQIKPPELIVQCKRYSEFSDLKSTLKNKELAKIQKLNPARYILTTSVSLSPQLSEEIKTLLSPFVQSTGDIYGRERLGGIAPVEYLPLFLRKLDNPVEIWEHAFRNHFPKERATFCLF